MPNLLLSFAVGFPYVPQPPPLWNTWTLGRKTARRRLAKAIRLLSVVRYFSPANFSAVAAAEPLQDHQISAIRHRRLPYSKWAYVRRQSRNRLFRKLLASIDSQLQKLRRATCPFINLPEKTKGRWGLGITPAVRQRCDWVKPVLIAQVKFTEWTYDDQLRQPVFLGLRTDKERRMSFANRCEVDPTRSKSILSTR